MPGVLLDVIDLNHVDDAFLIDTPSEGEEVLVFEAAKRRSRPGDAHGSDLLPLVLLRVVPLTEGVHLVVVEGACHVDKGLDRADGVISVGVEGIRTLLHALEELIVAVASVQVLVQTLDIASNEENLASVRGDRPTVERHLVVHLNLSPLEDVRLHFVNLKSALIPLERVQSLANVRHKAILHIVVYTHVALNQVAEGFEDLVRVLVEQSLKSAKRFKFVEILLELSIQISEDIQILLQHRYRRINALLSSQL